MARERVETVVAKIADPLSAELGYELVEVEYKKEGPDWVLRCTIDSETGISTNDCQRFSEALGEILDRQDPIPGSYLLEVSSPGIDRPLKKEQDFLRFAGKNIEIKLHQAVNGQKVLHGQLLGLGSDNPQLVQVMINQETLEIDRNNIAKARLDWEIFDLKGGKRKK